MRFRASCLAALVMAPLPALAEGPIARVSWTNPTQYIDGSALPAADLKEIVVSWGRSSSGPFTIGSVTVPSPATAVDIPGMVCGDYYFVARATVKTNETSAQTAAVVYATQVSCKTPNPPTATTVR